jgi:hypothetical protein
MAVETIRDLLNAYYGVVIAPRFQRNADIVGGSIQLLLKQDPSRIAFTIVNVSVTDVGVIPTGQPTAQKSFIVAANGGVLSGDWREDGELISQEWRAFAVAPPASLLILETLIEKPLPETKP